MNGLIRNYRLTLLAPNHSLKKFKTISYKGKHNEKTILSEHFGFDSFRDSQYLFYHAYSRQSGNEQY